MWDAVRLGKKAKTDSQMASGSAGFFGGLLPLPGEEPFPPKPVRQKTSDVSTSPPAAAAPSVESHALLPETVGRRSQMETDARAQPAAARLHHWQVLLRH